MLTAAHCVADSSEASEYIVQLGVHDRTKIEGTERLAHVLKVYISNNFLNEQANFDYFK